MVHFLAASNGSLHRAYSTPVRSHWDYYSADHALDDMLNAKYFRNHIGVLKPGDTILIIDKNEQEAKIRIQYLDDELHEVGLAIEREVVYEPAEGGYQIRHAGGRGRGTRYQIVDAAGQIVRDDLMGKKTADRELEALLREAA